MKEKVKLSVIIPTRDRIDELRECLDSLFYQTLVPDEIIVIDSGKTKVYSQLQKAFPVSISEIQYVYSNVCSNSARNIGVRKSSGSILFFFDDDVVLDKDYVKEILGVFANDDKRNIVGLQGNITNMRIKPTNSLTMIIGMIFRRLLFLSYYNGGNFRLSGLPTWICRSPEAKMTKVEFMISCASAFRRQVFDEFMFEEKLGMLSGYCAYDDVDFSYRVSRKYTLMYVPHAKLEHHRSKKARSNLMMWNRRRVFNYFYVFKKNMPKELSNILAFFVTLYAFLLFAWLFQKNLKGIIGWFRGIADVTRKYKLLIETSI